MHHADEASPRRPLRLVALDTALLLIPLAGYVGVAGAQFWKPPAANDPINYLRPVVWRDMTCVNYPDRLMVTLDMFVSDWLARPFIGEAAFRLGAFHPLLINALCLLVGAVYAYRVSGFPAALLYLLLLASSQVYVRYSTDAYPDIDMSLHTLAAGVALLAGGTRWGPLFCGLFCILVAITKPSAAATILVLAVYLWHLRHALSLRRAALGAALGVFGVAGLCLLAFDFTSIVHFFSRFGDRLHYAVESMTRGRAGVSVSVYEAVVSLEYFPLLIALVVLTSAWRHAHAQVWFALAAAHLLLLALLIGLSETLRSDNQIYYHTPSTCAALGIALVLGDLIQQQLRLDPLRARVLPIPLVRIAGLLLTIGVFCSFSLGLDRPAYGWAPSGATTPLWFRTLWAAGHLTLLLLLLVVSVRRSLAATSAFICGALLLMPYVTVSGALPAIQRHQQLRGLVYAAARDLAQLDRGPVGVFVDAFRDKPERYVDATLVIYNTFFGHFRDQDAAQQAAHRTLLTQVSAVTQPRQVTQYRYLIADGPGRAQIPDELVTLDELSRCRVGDAELVVLAARHPPLVPSGIWSAHPDPDAVRSAWRAYPFNREGESVVAVEHTREGVHVQLHQARDVRIVTGPGRYVEPPDNLAALRLPRGAALRVTLAGRVLEQADITAASIVLLDIAAGVVDLVPLELSRADATFTARGEAQAASFATDGFFRLMLHAHGSGTVVLEQVAIEVQHAVPAN